MVTSTVWRARVLVLTLVSGGCCGRSARSICRRHLTQLMYSDSLYHASASLRAILATIVIIGLSPITFQAAQENRITVSRDSVAGIITPALENQDITGVVVGILRNGKTQFFGFGVTSNTDHKPPDGKTDFEIASVTKLFTALLLADAVERHLVSLDDPVRKYLPEGIAPPLKPEQQEISLLDLATHRSGLPKLPNNFHPEDMANPFADYTRDKLYEFVAQYGLGRNSVEPYVYSNLGYALLGQVLERANGQKYEQLLRERITVPLRLKNTDVHVSQPGRIAEGHDADGNPTRPWQFMAFASAGGLHSNAEDLLRFIGANLEPTGSLASAIQLTHVKRGETDKSWQGWTTWKGSYAIGWHLRPGDKIYEFNGESGGYTSHVEFDPSAKTGIVVLINTTVGTEAFSYSIGIRIAALLRGATPRPLNLRRVAVLAPKLLDEYVGVYRSDSGETTTVRHNGTAMLAQVTGQSAYSIYAAAVDKFFWRALSCEYTFTRDCNRKVNGLVIHQFGRDTFLKKVETSPR